MKKNASFPAALVFALCLIALAWAYLIASETPRGQITGGAVLGDAKKPLANCDIYLTPAARTSDDAAPATGGENNVRESRHVKTDKMGRFLLRSVPAGQYHLSGSAKWHTAQAQTVIVREGGVSYATVVLTRSEADLSVGDHQAVFASREAPFLPVRGYATLFQTATAANSLHVKIWRTRLGDVLKRADAAADLDKMRHSYDGKEAALTPALLHPPRDEAPAPVLISDTVLPIKNADREGFFAEHFPLQAAQKKPGLYLVKFSYGTYSASSFVLVTNLALVVKKAHGAGQTVVYAADLMDGTPVKNASVRLLRKGQTLATSQTNASGLATLNAPQSGSTPDDAENETPLVTMASVGDDEAVLSPSSGGTDNEAKRYVVHVVTDRTVYRPGDTISYKGIVRTKSDNGDNGEKGGQAYLVPANVPALVEMRDESGGLIARQTKTTNGYGTVWGTMDTSKEGATGTYTLTTTINGETHDSEVVFAAYRKPEFSVTVTPQKARYLRGEPVRMVIKGTYYFGGPVAGATVHYSTYRDADWSAEYGDALSDEDAGGEDENNSAASYRSKSYQAYFGEGMEGGDIKLDENGQAVVTIRTDIRHIKRDGEAEGDAKIKAEDEPIPQVETYTLTAQVEDAAKRSVEADGAAAVAAGDVTVSVAPEGFVATPGKAMPVFVQVRDGQTKRFKSGVSVTLQAVYDTWNAYKKEAKTVPLSKPQTLQTGSDGRAIFPVTPPRSGEIRLIATVPGGGTRTVKAEGSLWAATDKGDDLSTDYGDLSLLTDKRHYLPGDTAKVLVNASRTGQSVLLSVEGERIYQTQVLHAAKKSTVFTLPIKAEWGPNVTLTANYVRNKKFASSQTPLRVSLPAQNLSVTVRPVDPPAQNKYQPGDRATFAVSIKNAATGKPVASDFSLGVVDESIYALREDSPKALSQTFHPKRTNRVSTRYSFSVEYLGDVSKAEPKIKARTKFRDTAFWKPDGHTNANGEATVSLTLPDNLTTWRATVQAVSGETSVGYGRSKIVSAKPFFVRLEMPRYLVGGDTSLVTVLVHNDTGQSQNVRVRLTASALHVTGDPTQTLTVASGAVGTVKWPVSPRGGGASDRAGLRVTAWTLMPQQVDKGKVYTDGVEQTLPLRAFGRNEFAPFAGTMNTNPSSETQTLTVLPGAISAETRLLVRVTPSLRGAISGGVGYLVGFPYGCTEQTLSRFVPDLLAERYNLLPAGNANQSDLPRMVGDGVTRLKRMQHGSGGWGWWEYDTDDPFMTAYALSGLAQAKSAGYMVGDDLMARGEKAAVEMAEKAPVRHRPYLLYALHQAGWDDKNHLLRAPFRYGPNRTHLVPAKLPVDALAYLVLLGHELNENYEPFYQELGRRGVTEGALLRFSAYPKKQAEYDNTCSDRMASALALRAFLAVRPDDARIPALIRYLMQTRTGGYFGDTRDTAWTLFAFCDYLHNYPREAAPQGGTVSVLVNHKIVETVQATGDNRMENGEVVLNVPTGLLHEGANPLQLTRSNASGGTIFYAGELRQTVSAPSNGDLPPVTEGVRVEREVLRIVPRKTSDTWQLAAEPVAGGPVKEGDRLRIRLTVTALRDASYVLIEDTFPSGAEVTERGTADEDVSESENGRSGGDAFWYDHVDVRDDRIAFFARKLPKGKHVLEYNLRAQTPGTGRALPASVRAMYDPAFRGESGTTVMEVRP